MAVTIKQTEAAPSSWPDAPTGLSEAAAALDADMIWQRIESYIAHRWTARDVVWIVEGAGDWTPPLTPTTVSLAEVWEMGEWSETTLAAGLTAIASQAMARIGSRPAWGAGTVPAAVNEAYKRLAEYSVEIGADGMIVGHPSHTSHATEIGSSVKESFDRSATWAARALINSGAADLLRPYRRA